MNVEKFSRLLDARFKEIGLPLVEQMPPCEMGELCERLQDGECLQIRMDRLPGNPGNFNAEFRFIPKKEKD